MDREGAVVGGGEEEKRRWMKKEALKSFRFGKKKNESISAVISK